MYDQKAGVSSLSLQAGPRPGEGGGEEGVPIHLVPKVKVMTELLQRETS